MGSFGHWAVILACSVAFATSAGAATIEGKGDPAQQEGVDNVVKRTFENITAGSYLSFTIDGVTFSGTDERQLVGPSGTPAPMLVNDHFPIFTVADVGPGPFPGYITDGTYWYKVTDGLFNTEGQSLSNGEESLNYLDGDPLPYVTQFMFEFDLPVEFFAFNLGGLDNTWTLTTYDVDDNMLDSLTIPPQPRILTGEYYGAISSVGIAYARLTSSLGFGQEWADGEMVLIDNFVTGSISRVPVPASLPLLVGAIGALGAAGWRRRKANA